MQNVGCLDAGAESSTRNEISEEVRSDSQQLIPCHKLSLSFLDSCSFLRTEKVQARTVDLPDYSSPPPSIISNPRKVFPGKYSQNIIEPMLSSSPVGQEEIAVGKQNGQSHSLLPLLSVQLHSQKRQEGTIPPSLPSPP